VIESGGGHLTLTFFSHSGKEARITIEKYLPVTFEVPKVLNQRHPTVFVRHKWRMNMAIRHIKNVPKSAS
jgi:hypothetical protein